MGVPGHAQCEAPCRADSLGAPERSHLERESAKSPAKGHIVNISGFSGQAVSVATIHVCGKAGKKPQVKGSCAPVKLYMDTEI